MRGGGRTRAVFVIAAMTGCGLFPSLDDLTAKPDAESSDVVTSDSPFEASVDASADAKDASADVKVDASGDGACTGTAGPTQVAASGVCIDSTEVTNGQYKQFLAASFTASMPPECSWNTSYEPSSWPPGTGTDDYPVAYVNWCDAYAFCEWAGKRLCGRIGGGPIAPSSAANASLDQWYSACSHAADGQHAFPYGNTFSSSACNGPEHDSGATLPVGFLQTCTGGYASMVDMVGNVYEWENGCSAATGASDSCLQRSGSFTDPSGSTQTCAYSRTAARNFSDNDIGFRCCGL